MQHTRSLRTAALVATVTLLGACTDATDPTGVSRVPVPGIAAARAPQAQARLEAVFQRIAPEVMALRGAVFSDNDERIGRLVVGVSDVGAARGVHQAMARLGVATGDYVVELASPILPAATLRSRFAEGQGGMQVNYGAYVCSVGFNVDHAAGRSFIINSHCTTTQGGTEGTLYYQPAQASFPVPIGTEAHDPAYARGNGCPKGKRCRWSDAARVRYADGYPSLRGVIARPEEVNSGLLTLSALTPTFTITAQDDAGALNTVGRTVNKVGRTTGWTRGAVTRTCVHTTVTGTSIYLWCQSFVQDPGGAIVVGGGDSGSGVWVDGESGVTLVGLLWGSTDAGRTFIFSPLAQVQRELGAVDAVYQP